jgi:TonB family protein
MTKGTCNQRLTAFVVTSVLGTINLKAHTPARARNPSLKEMREPMSQGAEMPATIQETDSDAPSPPVRGVALIGPNESSRRVMARAIAGAGAVAIREFAAYPASLSEIPRILDQNFGLVMIDVDSDESYALAIVAKIAAARATLVMAYSRRNQPELIARCMQAGARDFLPLPPDDEETEEVLPEPDPEPLEPLPPPPVVAATRVEAPIQRPEPPAIEPEPPVLLSEPEPPAKPPAEALPLRANGTERPPLASPLPEFEIPIFRFAGAAPPPTRPWFARYKWLLIGALLAAIAALATVLLHPWLHASTRGSASPLSSPGNPGSATSPVPKGWEMVTSSSGDSSAKLRATAHNGQATTAASSSSAVDPAAMNAQLNAPARISGDVKKPAPKDEPPAGFTPVGIENGSSVPGASFASGNQVKVAAAVTAVSAGVAAGLLIHRSDPVYPEFARNAHISGTVVLGATISKTGIIQDLHVISGPAVFTTSALNAVRTWRYRPYLLDGQPVEVQTTINVIFKLEK